MERGNFAAIAAIAALPPAAPNHHGATAVRASNGRHSDCLLSCCHCTEEPPVWQGRLSAQQPGDTGGGALRRVVVVVARVQLEYRVDPLVLIERLDLLRVLPDAPQDRVPGLALLVPQGEVDAVRPALGLMGEEVLPHAGKPEGAGHAAHPGKQIRLVEGVQGEQPGQGVPGNPAPTRNSGKFLLCRGDDLFSQKPQIVVCAACAGSSIFKSRRTVPGHHVVVPVQITDGHQCERWTASGLYSLKYLLSLTGESIEIDNWGF